MLVVAGDAVPLDGRPATGAGLRALGLGEGLRSSGHDVVYGVPVSAAHASGLEASDQVLLYTPHRIDDLLRRSAAEVAVFQHWPVVAALERPPNCPVVIDFHGPLLLETLYRDAKEVRWLSLEKHRALRRADFFTCAGWRQVHYFAGYLLSAGFDLREPPIEVVPFSMPPELPVPGPRPPAPRFVYGGVALPWQDPSVGLRVLADEIASRGAGTLDLYGGKHPTISFRSGPLDMLWSQLARSPGVQAHGVTNRSELVAEYRTATVAWDLMARNLERELAFTSRTVEYLWCGLPVVYNDYGELTRYIRDFDAGWVVAPGDEQAIRNVISEIYNDPAAVAAKSANAQQLVAAHLTWDRTIEPLAAFCREPRPARRLAW